MMLFIDTSTPTCHLMIILDGIKHERMWEADRQLAKGLLKFIDSALHETHTSYGDISGIGVFRGPGSFTGLRIGLTVANTIADTLQVPIVGAEDEAWVERAQAMLARGDNHRVVLPLYGREANITVSVK